MPNELDYSDPSITGFGLMRALKYRQALQEMQQNQQLHQPKLEEQQLMPRLREAQIADVESRPGERESAANYRRERLKIEALRASPILDFRKRMAGKGYGVEETPSGGVRLTEPEALGPLRWKPIGDKASDVVSSGLKAAEGADKLTKDFRENYGGSVILGWGGLENKLKRLFPWLELPDNTVGQAQWWSAKEDLDSLIRHPLFGSAFTATERAIWDISTFGPTDDSKFIKEKLKTRTKLMKRAVRRTVGRMRASGRYRPAEIEALIGQSFEEFDKFSRPPLEEILKPGG